MNNSTELTDDDILDLKDRLNVIMGYLRQIDPVNFVNQTSASKFLNVNRSNLSAALNGDKRYLHPNSAIIQAIFKSFNELNQRWFITGKGSLTQDHKVLDILSETKRSSFKELPISDQLNLIYESIQELNINMKNKISVQDEKIIKVIDYFESYVTPMWDFINNENKKTKKG